MICKNCQTELPDSAVACWKCGTPTAVLGQAPDAKPPRDVLHVVASFLVAAVLFICIGWPLPFVVWGNLSAAASHLPQWASVSGIASGIVLIGTALAFIALAWWMSYWVITRMFGKASGM